MIFKIIFCIFIKIMTIKKKIQKYNQIKDKKKTKKRK